jgi:hypothetical protein
MNVDLRDRLPGIRDQGLRPTCVAFAGTDLTDCYNREVNAPEFLAWCGWIIDDLDEYEDGMTLEAAGESLVRFGQPLEDQWPYDTTSAKTRPSLPVFRRARCKRRGSYSIIPRPSLVTFEDELRDGRPVVLGIELHKTFLYLSASAPFLNADDHASDILGLHAVTLVGFLANEPHRWILRNSWGSGWACSGHAFASDDFIEQCCRKALVME